jgi:fructose-1,6-bisphosphatase/inositol monophosphatase family enzyme/predicted metal-dependent phosphoesterase TrpH
VIGDLHVHTSRSDGSYSPKEAVLLAKERGLDYIGIVDHDTTEGLEEAIGLGLRLGVAVVRGIEISAYDFKRGRKAHLLGYNFDPKAEHLRSLCDPLLAARDRRTREQVATLAAAGYPISIEEVEAAAKGAATLYKQHAMSVLVRKGSADSLYGAEYRKLFGPGGICAGDIRYADAFDALRAIHEDGGVAVLAHPGQLDSWELLDELLLANLDGVELYHESHALADHEKVLARVRSWPGLILTGGSDDHGSFGSVNAMGDIRAPFGALEALGIAPALPYGFVADIVRRAGALLRSALAESIEIEEKGGDRRDLVTRYDSLVQEYLISGISARLPNHSFVAEETGAPPDEPAPESPDRLTWIIDPIDGTTNFACTGKDFAISVALYEGERPLLGLVYDVMADEMYSGAPGLGAYMDGSRLGRAGHAASLGDAVVDMSMDSCRLLKEDWDAEPEALALAGRGHRALGCASLNICRIARGSLDVYLSCKLAAWDYAAADIILAEAGGASTVRLLSGQGGGPRERRFYAAAGRPEVLSDALLILFGE